jgi:hypothetical protein
LFIGGLTFNDILEKGKRENFDYEYDVWREDKIRLCIEQRIELIKVCDSFFQI